MSGITRSKDMHIFKDLNIYYKIDFETDQVILNVEP